MRSSGRWCPGIAFLAVLFSAVLSHGQTARWTNTVAGGNWSATGNWSPNAVPGPTTNVFLTNTTATSYFTTNDILNETIASLTMSNTTGAAWVILNTNGFNVTGNVALNRNSGFDINGFSALIGGNLTVTNSSAVVVRGATLTNLGNVAIQNSTCVLAITNNGVLQVGASGLGTMSSAGTTTLHEGGSILAGVVTNTGTIKTFSGSGLISGFLQNNGTLVLSNAASTLSVVGGGFNAGSILLRNNSAVLNIGGTNQAQANASGLTMTNTAAITFGASGLSFAGGVVNANTNGIGIVNQGTLAVSAGASSTTGTVNAVVVNDVGGTIATANTTHQLNILSLVTNRGTVNVGNSNNGIVINQGDVVNEGLIRNAPGGGFTVAGGRMINATNGSMSIANANGGSLSALSTLNYGSIALTNDDASTQNFALGGAITNAGLFTVMRTVAQADSVLLYVNSGGFVNTSGIFRAVGSYNTLTNLQAQVLIPGTVLNNYGGTILATNGAIFGFNALQNSTNGQIIAYANSVVGNGAASSSTGVAITSNRRVIANGSLPVLNEGTITLAGGGFGAAVVTNTTVGTIQGNGSIGSFTYSNLVSGIVTNYGRILRVRDIINSGLISPNGVLNAGNITNLSGGTILGFGTIQSLNTTNRDDGTMVFGDQGARILNSAGATVLASGGTLVLSNGFFSNSNAGTIGATNSGILQLGDGTLALTNNGVISLTGGELRSGDLRNNSNIVMSSGANALTVSGSLFITNNASLLASNTIASITGVVTNQGSIHAVNSKVTFSNALIVSGSYVSDPSTNTFVDNVTFTSSGTLTGTAGDLFEFKKNLTLNNAAQSQFAPGAGTLLFDGGGVQIISGALTIAGTGTMRISNTTATVSSAFTNQGLVKVENSLLTFSNRVTISGRYVSDPSTNTFFDDVTIAPSGTLEGGAGDVFDFKKSLIINSTNTAFFNLASSTVLFDGGVNHTNAITGLDLGTNQVGFASGNFSYGLLKLGNTSDNLYLIDGDGNGANTNALYVDGIDLGGLTNNVSLLHSSFNIYYDEFNPVNAYLGARTFALDQGGFLIAVPEPSALLLLLAGSGLLVRRRS